MRVPHQSRALARLGSPVDWRNHRRASEERADHGGAAHRSPLSDTVVVHDRAITASSEASGRWSLPVASVGDQTAIRVSRELSHVPDAESNHRRAD
jgi:hypothetical protein